MTKVTHEQKPDQENDPQKQEVEKIPLDFANETMPNLLEDPIEEVDEWINSWEGTLNKEQIESVKIQIRRERNNL